MSKSVVISGAGVVGIATAIGLAQMGYKVKVYEKRTNPSKSALPPEKRSLKLDISYRGQLMLHSLGIIEEIKKHSIILSKRIYHTNQGNVEVETDVNSVGFFSISHSKLWQILLDKSKLYDNIELLFGVETINFDNTNNIFNTYHTTLNNTLTEKIELLLVCDGVNSNIRKSLKESGVVLFRERIFPGQYKEIEIYDPKNNLDIKATHFWFSKAGIMLVVHPTMDQAMEGHLFLDKSLNQLYGCNDLNTDKVVKEIFLDKFPDLAFDPVQVIDAPIGEIKMVDQVQISGLSPKVFLMGDTMHSMVPFLGQGVNCGLEDSYIFLQKLKNENIDLGMHSNYHEHRISNANALVEMSLKNAPEFIGAVSDNRVMISRFIDNYLKHYYEWYVPFVDIIYFSNVQFTRIQKIREIQRNFLNSINSKYNWISDIDYNFVHSVIKTIKQDLLDLYEPISDDIYQYKTNNLKLR